MKRQEIRNYATPRRDPRGMSVNAVIGGIHDAIEEHLGAKVERVDRSGQRFAIHLEGDAGPQVFIVTVDVEEPDPRDR